MSTWFEASLRLPDVPCDDPQGLHRAVWMNCRTSKSQPTRDFLYCALPDDTTGGSLIRVRSAVPRPGWTPRSLAKRLVGGIAFAYGRTCDSCKRIDVADAERRLAKRLEANGFSVASLDVSARNPIAAPHTGRDDRGGAWWAFDARFVLDVVDPAKAEALWVEGIGKGKAFGFGMPVAVSP